MMNDLYYLIEQNVISNAASERESDVDDLEIVNHYARWELYATIGNVQVSALCITDEHKEKTLKIWKGMRAKNVLVVARSNVPALPVWRVRAPSSRCHVDVEVAASSKQLVEQHLDKKLKLKKWQIFAANIERKEA